MKLIHEYYSSHPSSSRGQSSVCQVLAIPADNPFLTFFLFFFFFYRSIGEYIFLVVHVFATKMWEKSTKNESVEE